MFKKSIIALLFHCHNLLDLLYEELTRIVRIWKGEIMACLRYSSGSHFEERGENEEEIQSGYPIAFPVFELDSSGVQSLLS
jgi:hypothetical protein